MSNANPFANNAPVAGPYSGADNKDPVTRLPKVGDDFRGRVRVELVKHITTREGSQVTIVEFTVLTSNKADVLVGGRYSWMQGMKERDTAYNALISFLYACMGLVPGRDKATIDMVLPHQTNLLNQMVSTQQTCAGCEVMLATRGIITEKKKVAFTVHDFSAAPPATA